MLLQKQISRKEPRPSPAKQHDSMSPDLNLQIVVFVPRPSRYCNIHTRERESHQIVYMNLLISTYILPLSIFHNILRDNFHYILQQIGNLCIFLYRIILIVILLQMKQTIFLEMQKQHMVQKIYYLKKGVGVGTSRFSSLSNLAVS